MSAAKAFVKEAKRPLKPPAAVPGKMDCFLNLPQPRLHLKPATNVGHC
jgi:hypothetical protein